MQPTVETLGALVAADAGQEALLQFALEDAAELARSYCHLDTLPAALDTVVLRMAADLWRAGRYGQADGRQVKSVTDGAQSATYESLPPGEVLERYATRLDAYRRLKWPRYGDV